MNGNGYDYYGDEYTPMVSQPVPPLSTGGITAPSTVGILDQLKGVFERFTSRPTSTPDSATGVLYNAIYAFGAGKVDVAKENLARAFLATKTGASFASSVEQERIKQLAPMFIMGAVILFGLAFFLGRR